MRTLSLITGWFWATVLGVAGLVLWGGRGMLVEIDPNNMHRLIQVLAVLCLSGAQFVLMVMVADELCPRAPAAVTAMLKMTAGLVVWVSLLAGGWLMWTMAAGG